MVLNAGLACRHMQIEAFPLGHMWLWWTDAYGIEQYRGYWPNAEEIENPEIINQPTKLIQYLKERCVAGVVRRDKAAHIATQYRSKLIFQKRWFVSTDKLARLDAAASIPEHLSERQTGRYSLAIKGCDNCVSWAVKQINNTVGDAYTIAPFWPPKVVIAAQVIFDRSCDEFAEDT